MWKIVDAPDVRIVKRLYGNLSSETSVEASNDFQTSKRKADESMVAYSHMVTL